MPAAIPDRFKLEMRLGRDGDIEEWLATDTSLDRPVLVRSLGPESDSDRRSEFVDRVSAAAKASASFGGMRQPVSPSMMVSLAPP